MPGFFGKIPAHGDFVTRNLARGFLDVWDGWLQACMAESRARLGDEWLDAYLTSPIWRFALSPGVCGAGAWAGVLMPSVDRVGRYFPLTIATALEAGVTPFDVAAHETGWFGAAEALALHALDDDTFEAGRLLEALEAIEAVRLAGVPREAVEASGSAWSCVVVGPGERDVPAAIAHELVRRHGGAYTLWWTPATDSQPAAVAAVQALPEPSGFAEWLRGTWTAAA